MSECKHPQKTLNISETEVIHDAYVWNSCLQAIVVRHKDKTTASKANQNRIYLRVNANTVNNVIL